MNEKDFLLLMSAVKGVDAADILEEKVKTILIELLDYEFRGIPDRKFKIVLQSRKDRALAAISKVDDKIYLFVDPDVNPLSLRGLIKHELCHVEADFADDSDPRFKDVARAHGAELCQP